MHRKHTPNILMISIIFNWLIMAKDVQHIQYS